MAADWCARTAQLRDSGAHPRRTGLALPAFLRLGPANSPLHGLGVFATVPLPRGLSLGPYEGRPVMAEAPTGTSGYSWRVRHGRLVAAGDEAHSNWMRFVNCTPHASSQNLVGFQYRGALYFRTAAPVAVGDELLVYYGDDHAHNVDVDGYYNYHPPVEEPGPELCSSNGDAGDDCGPPDGYCDSVLLKEDPDSKVIDIYHPLKEEPEPELGDTDTVDVSDYGSLKVEPKSESDGYPPIINVDDYHYRPPPFKEELESKSIDICYHPIKQEPGMPAMGDEVVFEGGQDVGYDCSHCGVNLCTQEFKVKHEARCKGRMKRKGLKSQIVKSYHCDYCKCPFLSKEYKERHQKKCRKKPGTYFRCNKCEYITKWKQCLARHLLNHNKNNAEWFICALCSYKTVHKYSITKHTKDHSNTCPICGKSFSQKWYLDDHLLKQHSDKSHEVSKLITNKIYTCPICNQYRTIVEADFNEHVIVTHLKSVRCQKYECPYSTLQKYHLNMDLQMHGKQKYYRCTDCKKQFTRKRVIDSHGLCNHSDNVDLMKTITSKTYCCESCSFKAVARIILQSLVRSKHLICSNAFVTN